jgi:hypothetical protein
MEATKSSFSWPETALGVGLNASKDYRAYVVLVLCALLGWALLVLRDISPGRTISLWTRRLLKTPCHFGFSSLTFRD